MEEGNFWCFCGIKLPEATWIIFRVAVHLDFPRASSLKYVIFSVVPSPPSSYIISWNVRFLDVGEMIYFY